MPWSSSYSECLAALPHTHCAAHCLYWPHCRALEAERSETRQYIASLEKRTKELSNASSKAAQAEAIAGKLRRELDVRKALVHARGGFSLVLRSCCAMSG